MAEKVLFIRLPEATKQQVEQEADRLGLSTADFIRLLVNQYFDDIQFSRKTPKHSK